MSFPLQPTITNDLVRIQPLQPDDFEALYAAAADPLLWEQHPSRDRYKREVFETFFAGALESGGAFLVLDAATNAVIGSSRYYEWNAESRTIAIGYTFICRSHWGGGYNRALKTLMLNHAFQYADQVLFYVGATNFRSRRAMEKLGGQLVAEQEVAYYGERSNPNVVYQIARKDWVAQQDRDQNPV